VLAAILTLLALLLTGVIAPVAGAMSSDGSAQIVVYLEVPAAVVERTRLDLDRVTLASEADTLTLACLQRELVADRLAGKQIRLIDQDIPHGIYRTLTLVFGGVEGHLGEAPVHPPISPDGLAIDLDVEIRSGECELVMLQWSPSPLPATSEVFTPNLEAMTPDVPPLGSLAFVSNEGSDNISVIDRFSHRVVDVIMVGAQPRGLAYSRREQQLYVAISGDDAIAVIDVLSLQTMRKVTTGFGDEPTRLLLSSDETTLYVLNHGAATLTVLNVGSWQERSRIATGQRPRALTEDRLTGFVYISSELTSEVLVYDPNSDSVVNSFTLDSSPTEIAYDATTRRLYLASAARGRLLALNTDSGVVTAQLSVCAPADGLAFHPASRRLYAALAGCREISVSLPEQDLEVATIRLPDRPGLMAFDAEYRLLLVTLPATARLAVCNPNSTRLVGLVEVGQYPHSVIVP